MQQRNAVSLGGRSAAQSRSGGLLLTVLAGWLALGSAAAAGAPAHAPGDSFRDCPGMCPELVVLPPGSFLMGSPPGDAHQGSGGEEQPQHRVTINYPLAVAKFETTRDEYAEFVRDTSLADPPGCNVHRPPRWPTVAGLSWHDPGFPQSGRDPVICVSWTEAEAYTRWLSRKTGHAYRLLSEAEWEYAARAGTTSQAFWGDDPAAACRYANGVDQTLMLRFPMEQWEDVVPCADHHVYTAPVGSYQPNPFGLYDMLGNAFEWVADCLADNYQGAPTDGAARMDGECLEHINRGGSWTSNPTGLRAAHRGNDDATATRVVDLGFRVARQL